MPLTLRKLLPAPGLPAFLPLVHYLRDLHGETLHELGLDVRAREPALVPQVEHSPDRVAADPVRLLSDDVAAGQKGPATVAALRSRSQRAFNSSWAFVHAGHHFCAELPGK